MQVLKWLMEFEASPRQIVLDYGWEIIGEYQNKLTSQDYALLVVLQMWSTDRVHGFLLEKEIDGRIADSAYRPRPGDYRSRGQKDGCRRSCRGLPRGWLHARQRM
jgi:hypothetical protein